jgi:HEAT repeat protein
MKITIGILLLLLAFTGLSGTARAAQPEPPQPRIEGRPLAYWYGLLTQADARQRARGIRAIGTLGARALPVLQWALDDDDERVRIAAVEAIGMLGQQAAPVVDTLADLLATDPSRAVRFKVIAALAALGPTARPALPALHALLQQGDLAIRVATARAVDRITDAGR